MNSIALAEARGRTLSQASLFDDVMKMIHTPNVILKADVTTLLAQWDNMSIACADEWISDFTYEVLRPMRIMILKTFLSAQYPHMEELKFHYGNKIHPAFLILEKAWKRKETMRHDIHYHTFDVETSCCNKWEGPSNAGYVCMNCMTNMCPNCEDAFCPQQLNDLITQLCRVTPTVAKTAGEMENYLMDDPAKDMDLEILWDKEDNDKSEENFYDYDSDSE